jgi:uncharacterized membrane protein YbhN (UPF0104 family)
LGPVIVLAVFVGAIWLVYHELRNYRLSDIGAKILEISPLGITAAVVLTIINYAILVGYDGMAVRYIGERLPLRRIALAAFTGYACSYNFGATLAGSTIRIRLYSAWGMSAVKILELLVILGLTFWFGLFGLAGVIFVADPPQIAPPKPQAVAHAGAEPQAGQVKVVEANDRWNNGNGAGQDADETRRVKRREMLERIVYYAADLRYWGVLLLVISAAYLSLSAASLTHIKIFGRELPVPPFKLTLYQFGIVAADMLVAGAVIYSLMGHIPGVPGYAALLGIYLLVYVAVVLSHVPGGYGVFEAGMLFCLRQASPTVATDSVMAAIFVFRVIYFWAPLLLAIILLGINEVILRRRSTGAETPAAG